MDERALLRLTTHPITTWWIRHVASHIDPWLFRASNGRFFSMGVPSQPMLTLTTTGRRSGRRRSVHLACIEHDGDHLVVASAMGQRKHPAWRYNLEANPEVEVQLRGRRFPARARPLDDAEKAALWPEIKRAIPQLEVYEQRTQRNIQIFRLRATGTFFANLRC